MPSRPTALIAEDEPLLRERLVRHLGLLWPELDVIAQARNGVEAVDQFEAQQPDICFLDVHMPGMSGLDVAKLIGRRAHLVFVTAYDEHAVQAFTQGALDYLVKPVEPERLADTVARLRARLEALRPAVHTDALLQQLTTALAQQRAQVPAPLRWIRAQTGQTLRVIAVDDVDYLRADAKYTIVAWRGEDGQAVEGVVRTPLRDLAAQLDPALFVQTHRSVVVNLRAISQIRRHDNETAEIVLKRRKETLPVSRSYLHLFRQM
jgi:DNA-binding LytR/AlgR family response regulator